MSFSREDDRSAMLVVLSGHLPEIGWDEDERVARIVCSCGSGIYPGHLVTMILNRLHGEEMAEWERDLLEQMAREDRHLRAVGDEDA